MANAAEERGIGEYIIVRPSLLNEGERGGLGKVRAGGEEDPAVGYVIAREDVGRWVLETSVRGKGKGEGGESGRVVSITT